MHKKLIEAALFISNRPLTLDELAKIAGISSVGFVKDILEKMQKEYKDKGFEIIKTQQGWHMQVRQEFLSMVAHLTPYSDIPEGAKRTLALIIYKEPIKQSEIIKIQGNKAYSYIKFLKKRDLIKAEKQGRTKIIKLTPEFEKYFGEEREKIKQAFISEFGAPEERVEFKSEEAIEAKPQPVQEKIFEPSPEFKESLGSTTTEPEAREAEKPEEKKEEASEKTTKEDASERAKETPTKAKEKKKAKPPSKKEKPRKKSKKKKEKETKPPTEKEKPKKKKKPKEPKQKTLDPGTIPASEGELKF